jgi:S1-C subfamily serine protease
VSSGATPARLRVARWWLGALLVVCAVSAADARPWAWLGVRIRDLSEGVMIVDVMPDTPAARAGIKSGDVVVAIGDRPVVETLVLQRLIAGAPVGSEVRLTVLREEGRRPLRARLAAMPREAAGERVAAELGFVLRETEPPTSERAGARPSSAPTVGVVIRGSAAEKAGLEVGDGILQVNEHSVLTRDAAREALAEVDLEAPLRLTVRRGQSRVTLTLSRS